MTSGVNNAFWKAVLSGSCRGLDVGIDAGTEGIATGYYALLVTARSKKVCPAWKGVPWTLPVSCAVADGGAKAAITRKRRRKRG
jgi:hypothetical protein